jgi:hypothetical protein
MCPQFLGCEAQVAALGSVHRAIVCASSRWSVAFLANQGGEVITPREITGDRTALGEQVGPVMNAG